MTRDELNSQRMWNEAREVALRYHTRRHFLKECAMGFGALALGSLITKCGSSPASAIPFDAAHPMAPKIPPLPPNVRSVIYLHMAGAPSQLELFDYKPELAKLD